MIPVLQYCGETVAVVGLGASGLSAARALAQSGATVLVWDDAEAGRAKAQQYGLRVVEPSETAWASVRRVIWSPGIPHTHPAPHPAATLARKLGIPLACDVDLLCQARPQAGIIAVTGTNGKSTTTALIAHLLASARIPSAAGGNLGTPALELPELPFTGSYVLELSSYQLELVPSLHAEVMVWLNISPDHLSRHGGLEGYIAAKKQIFKTDRRPATAVIGVDDPASFKVYEALHRAGCLTVVPVAVAPGTPQPERGVFVRDGILYDVTQGGRPRRICDLSTLPSLPGLHNQQNAACAYAAARARGVAVETIVEALATFPGLAHRQQFVAEIEEVAFINDSKATNADAAARALACYDKILWIAGGIAKEGGIDSLTPYFPRIRHAYLIGEAAPAFAATLKAGGVAYTLCATLQEAVEQADENAEVGDTVLLSPACASFDQFRSFEHRGDTFIQIVRDLAEADEEDDEDQGEDEEP